MIYFNSEDFLVFKRKSKIRKFNLFLLNDPLLLFLFRDLLLNFLFFSSLLLIPASSYLLAWLLFLILSYLEVWYLMNWSLFAFRFIPLSNEALNPLCAFFISQSDIVLRYHGNHSCRVDDLGVYLGLTQIHR